MSKHEYRFLRFGEGHTATDKCKPCEGAGVERPATGLAMLGGWFPIFACDEHDEKLRRAELAAIADENLRNDARRHEGVVA